MTPQFFIVGAPRCGTTSLSRYLAKHPQVCFSKPKEPHFFTFGTQQIDTVDLERDYLARFFPHFDASQHSILGEGSVSYLYAPDAIRRILSFKPQAKFIVSVRNPIDLIRSYHARMLYILDETEPDLAQAWHLQAARAAGRKIPRTCRDPHLLHYRDVGRLGHNLERLLEIAGEERCKVVVFDDLVADPLTTYRGVLDFLELDYDGQTRFARKRRSRGFRRPFLQRLLVRPPIVLILLLGLVQRLTGIDRLDRKVRERLKQLNGAPTQKGPIDRELHRTLGQAFADDVALLSDLLERDLSHWLTGPDPKRSGS